MPAAKSRKRLPSMSSTVRPSPRTGTIGYARGRLGDVQVSSNATWARAFGPGSSVTMCGTGRSPAIRDVPDDKTHLFVVTVAARMHNEYADWISEPSIAARRMAVRGSPVGWVVVADPPHDIGAMSTSELGGVTAHEAQRGPEPLVMGTRARLWAHVVTHLWPHDRGLAELRWASVTVAVMAGLGVLATLIDPVSGDFVRPLVVAVPAAILLAVVAWGGLARGFARSRAIRLSLGPFVLLVAVVAAGLSDIKTLSIPAAAPLIVLAMAYAALTPGFRDRRGRDDGDLDRRPDRSLAVHAVGRHPERPDRAVRGQSRRRPHGVGRDGRRRAGRDPGGAAGAAAGGAPATEARLARDAQSDHRPVRRVATAARGHAVGRDRHRARVRDHPRHDVPAVRQRAASDGRRRGRRRSSTRSTSGSGSSVGLQRRGRRSSYRTCWPTPTTGRLATTSAAR